MGTPNKNVSAEVLALSDQSAAMARELAGMVVTHWETSSCHGTKYCLGGVAFEIETAVHLNPHALGMALQGAIGMLARAEYERRHPDDGEKAV